jgi:hypothetical protein
VLTLSRYSAAPLARRPPTCLVRLEGVLKASTPCTLSPSSSQAIAEGKFPHLRSTVSTSSATDRLCSARHRAAASSHRRGRPLRLRACRPRATSHREETAKAASRAPFPLSAVDAPPTAASSLRPLTGLAAASWRITAGRGTSPTTQAPVSAASLTPHRRPTSVDACRRGQPSSVSLLLPSAPKWFHRTMDPL